MMAQRRERPVIIGIVGDSGAGKSTFAAGLAEVLGRERTLAICIDDYHRYARAERAVNGLTPHDPACNYLDILEQHIDLLRAGEPILKPVYNHVGGVLEPPEYVEPRRFIILEGLHGYATPRLREAYDLKILLEPQETAAPALEVPARHRARRLRLHRRAGDGAAAEAEPRQRALRRSAARLRRHGDQLLRAGRAAGGERRRPQRPPHPAADAAVRRSGAAARSGRRRRPGAGTGARRRRPAGRCAAHLRRHRRRRGRAAAGATSGNCWRDRRCSGQPSGRSGMRRTQCTTAIRWPCRSC